MCTCYDGECKCQPKPVKKTIKLLTANEGAILEADENRRKEVNLKKDWKINHNHYTDVVDIRPIHFIRSKKCKLLFYNEWHKIFLTFNMADKFTLRRANEIMRGLEEECEAITFERLKKEYKFNEQRRT